MISIFLSYARGDDEAFVRRLYDDLTTHDFDVWFDRVSMPSRQLTFLQEIRDAIAARDRLLLVIGPNARTSDYVVQEWSKALEMGKCVNLIVRLNGGQENGRAIDGYALIPDELRLFTPKIFATTHVTRNTLPISSASSQIQRRRWGNWWRMFLSFRSITWLSASGCSN